MLVYEGLTKNSMFVSLGNKLADQASQKHMFKQYYHIVYRAEKYKKQRDIDVSHTLNKLFFYSLSLPSKMLRVVLFAAILVFSIANSEIIDKVENKKKLGKM